MATDLNEVPLTRPATTLDDGPLDERLYDLIEERFRRVVRANPILGTYVGIHTEDGRLGDGSRDAILGELDADKRHLSELEALDTTRLSPLGRFERDLALHNVRREIFETDVVRRWERRSFALDVVGDGIFLLFARDFGPLGDRLVSIADRLEAIPAFLEQSKTRATVPQVRLWQTLEIDAAEHLPALFREVRAASDRTLDRSEHRRLCAAIDRANVALAAYRTWLQGTLPGGTDDWALGTERYDELIAHRAFDGLDADAILELGWQQLRLNHDLRSAAAREIDPDASEADVIDRLKEDHPATFEEALAAYREAMVRARSHLIERDIVTVPDDERIEVIETPEYLRNVVPFAAYFSPPKFDANPTGIYIVTPAVHDDPNAMREHNRTSMSNTSVHEAYPGHHLQLSVAARHPSLARLEADASEFVEGWGMYSEQMMREEGFDDAANFRLNVATDAIWRACRIILDVRMHRGEVGVDDAVAFLVEHTAFETANARAEVERYTYTPSYQLSYLLGKVLILGLRDDERRRLGGGFSLKQFHDTLLRNGSLPISFHRRLLDGELDEAGVGARGAGAAAS
ncbi:MAG: DUF885 domain-containing protein [Chloroflexota bacterium]